MREKGFTLVELLVTVTILALLASVALPLAELTVQRAKEKELRTALRDVRTAIDAYKQAVDEGRVAKATDDASGYPPSLALLVEGVEDRKKGDGTRIFFLRRLPADPVSGDEWGLRSYASPPSDPQPGKDVFDIYSQSNEKGLNGVAYREW